MLYASSGGRPPYRLGTSLSRLWIGGRMIVCVLMLLLIPLMLFALTMNPSSAEENLCTQPTQPATGAALKVALVPQSSTAWQPPGGTVVFTLTGDQLPVGDMKVDVCFRWHGLKEPLAYHATPEPTPVSSGLKTGVTLAVQVPQELNDDRPNWFATGDSQRVAYTGFGLVPLADMRVVATSANAAWKRIDITQQVGITNRWFALLPALAGLVIGYLIIYAWGRTRGVRGGLILSVISSQAGYASLAQFQILLWTFLLAAGVMYVIALSGSMIDIPAAALGLLGITGIATLGSKLNAAQGTAAPVPNPPGATTGLVASGAPTDTSVTLTWDRPGNADPTAAYTVQVRPQNTRAWSTATAAAALPPFAITGLTPNTAYEFQVYAVNDAGAGPASMPVQANTAAAPGAAALGAPGAVSALRTGPGRAPESSIVLTWAGPAPGPEGFVVRYRPGGSWTWSTASGTPTSPFTVTGLQAATAYEFQIYGVKAGIAGTPSDIATAVTAARTPRWSDLVVTSDEHEVDITRVQMLLFTVVAAVFVALKLFDDNRIPDIPAGILTLIGISNGVYLAAKFIPTPQRRTYS
jgi:hypothetical protein